MMIRKCKIFHVFLLVVSCLLTTDYANAQFWRDSSFVGIPSPAGKKIRITQFSIGDTTWKTAGGLAVKGNYLLYSNGTTWFTVATSASGAVGNSDSLGGVPASGYVRTTTDQNINGYKSFLDSIIVGVNSSLAGIVRFEGGNTGVGRLTTSLGNQNRTWTLPDQTGTILVNADTTTFRTRSDSLYARKATTNIFTGINYFTTGLRATSYNVTGDGDWYSALAWDTPNSAVKIGNDNSVTKIYGLSSSMTFYDGLIDISAGDGVALSGSITIGSSGSAFEAKVDSNAMEFTSSSVEYRAMQTAYAKLYHDTTTAYSIALGTADSFYTIKNWNQSLGIRKNASITDSSIIIRVAGVYQIYYSISSGSSSASTVLKTSIFRNFSRVGGTSAEQKIATANDIGDMSAMGFLYCSAGDYIQIRVRRESGAGTCDIYNAQLVVTRID